MSFPYTRGLPNPPNDPSVDAPSLQTNTNTVDDWTSVDHIGFNQSLGGQHAQVRFPSTASPGSQTGLASVEYTSAGVASNTSSQLYYKNSLTTLPLSLIRAYARCDSSGAIISGQSFNVTGVAHPGTGNYVVTLTAGAVTTNSYGVIVTSQINQAVSVGAIAGYQAINASTINLNFCALTGGFLVDPVSFTFIVLQI